MAFSKEDKILIKNLQQLKSYTAMTVFLENSEPKTGQEHKSWFWNKLLYKLIILLNKPYFDLLCAN